MATTGLWMMAAVAVALIATGLPAWIVLIGVAVAFSAGGLIVGAFTLPILTAVPARILGLLENDLLQALPLYVLMGALLNHLPLAQTLFRATSRALQRSGAGTALAGLGLGVLLAPMNGSVGASVATLGRTVFPRLDAAGMPAEKSAALVCVASTLGVVVPPSLVLILLSDAMMRAHKALTRQYDETPTGKREAVRFAFIDSTIALSFALFINAAILIIAAATFHTSGHAEVGEIQDAYKLLTPLLGAGASTVFALALLASGQNSTLTGTLAGQIVMEGFLNIRLRPWLRRLITRAIAIVPAAIVAIMYGESGTAKLLVFSQVILSMQLSFAVFPLVKFTSDRVKMGEFVNPIWLKSLAYLVAFIIAGLNVWLLFQFFSGSVG